MKIAVIGAGAMGSIYASFLSKNNNEVLVIDIWEEHLEAIKNNGLRVSGFSGDNVVKNINVSSNIEDAKGYELFIIATKASGVGTVASKLSEITNDDSLILTIQNGLGAGERIAKPPLSIPCLAKALSKDLDKSFASFFVSFIS